ncbi:hypothetical protein IWW37_003405 [Coemansia sp. RSA 2050]|nr:hypothetical protein IWW37_003405 [Coemansia sp. RSA 2050]KAJ2733046.1 hypothetical protein IW152_003369 [Coemansia sp. BCRC 34962]
MKAKVLYNQRHRPKLRISFPDKDSKEITAMLADQWTKASDEERDYFLAKERALMDQYNKDLAEYEAQSGGSEVLVCTGQPAPLASEGHSSLGLPETSGDVGNVDSSNDVKPKKKKKRRPNYDDVGLDLGLELGESFKKKKKKRRSKSKDELLPQATFNKIALDLEAEDLAALMLVSRRLNRLASCDELWIEKISADFGDREHIIDMLAEAGVDIAELAYQSTDLVPWRRQQLDDEPDSEDSDCNDDSSKCSNSGTPNTGGTYFYTGAGVRCYRDRFIRVFPRSGDDAVSTIKSAEATLEAVKHMLRDGPRASSDVFAEAAYRLVLVQEYYPNSAECYYLWALICFVLNSFKPSLSFIGIGQSINGEFAPLKELAQEVQSIVAGAYGTGNQVPLLDSAGSGPSPHLAKVLAIVFQRLDSDHDGVLNAAELSHMVRQTNGQAPPPAAISQIIGSFGGQIRAKNGRMVQGWSLASLTDFYIAQTLDDPSETRKDLAKFGFDPSTLKYT